LTAVVSNNIVAINKEKDLFDSKKRLRSMNVSGLENKLTKYQQQTVEVNKCLLNMFMNQIDACKKSLNKLKQFSTSSNLDLGKAAILEAAVHLKDKHPDQAMGHLKSLIENGTASDDIRLALAQLLFQKSQFEEGIALLETLSNDIKYSPSIVSLLVGLYTHIGNREKGSSTLDLAVDFNTQKQTDKNPSRLLTLLRESASQKMLMGNVNEAIKILEHLRKEDTSDIRTLAKIVAAYSKTDQNKAYEFSQDLPEFSSVNGKIDVNALEMVDMIGNFRFSKKTAQDKDSSVTNIKEVKVQKKKKKKKKGKKKKKIDPEVDPDPERWLPRWERSTFKHKKQKRGAQSSVGKGTQGSAEPATAANQASPRAASTSSPKPGDSGQPSATQQPPSSPQVVPPRQQKPQATKGKQQKKKKKSHDAAREDWKASQDTLSPPPGYQHSYSSKDPAHIARIQGRQLPPPPPLSFTQSAGVTGMTTASGTYMSDERPSMRHKD
jgi:signal recognition particle subunit SRP72